MRRLIGIYIVLAVLILLVYSVLVLQLERDTAAYHEALFNEQQAVLVRLSARGLENYFERVVEQTELIVDVLGQDGGLGRQSPAGLDQRFSAVPGLGREFVALGYFALDAESTLVASVSTVDDVSSQLMQGWVEGYTGDLRVGSGYVMTDFLVTPAQQQYGLLYPVAVDEQLAGVLVFVMDLGPVWEAHVAPVRSGQYGAAWALDGDGLVLYDHETEIIGENVLALHQRFPDLQAIDTRILSEDAGQGEYHFTVERGGAVDRKLVAWDTAYLGDYVINVAMSSIDAEINAGLESFRQRALFFGGLLALGLIASGTVLFRSRQRVLEQQVAARTYDLAQAEGRYRALFEHARDAIVVTDDTGRFVEVNAQAVQLTGYAQSELLTMKLPDLMPAEMTDRFDAYYEASRRSGGITTTFQIVRQDGCRVDVEVAVTRVADGRYQSIMRDVTARLRTEQSLRRYNEAMLVLNQAAIAITSELNRDEIMQRLVHTAEQVLPEAAIVTVQLRDPHAETMRTNVASEHATKTDHQIEFRPGVGIAGHAVAMRRVINVPDIRQDERFVMGSHEPNFRSLLVAPLVTAQSVWGTLSITNEQPGAFADQHELLANLLAQQAAVAIENASLYRAEQQQRERADALRDIGLVLTGALRQEHVLERILEQVARVVPYDAAGVWLVEPSGGYSLLAGIGYEQFGVLADVSDLIWTPDDDSVMTSVGGAFESIVISDVSEYPGWVALAGYEWLRSWAGVPITARGELLGVLCLDHTQPGFYRPEHIPVLEGLATQISIAIENAQLFEQVQDYAHTLAQQVEQQTAQIRLAQERLATILNNIGDGVVTTTPQGRITYANPAFERLVGWEQAELLDRPVAKVIHRATPREAIRCLVGTVRAFQPWRGEFSLRHRDGYEVYVEGAGMPFQDEVNQVEGYIVSIRNLRTEQVLERMKARFITLISHQLRTPLTNLKLYVHLVRRTLSDPERTKSHLDALSQQTDRLAHIMEKVLTITRLADSHVVAAPRQVHFTSLLDNISVRFASVAEVKGITLAAAPRPTDLPPVYGDEQWLTQACFELVENALTYTPAGGRVELTLTMLARHDVDCVALRVQDTGPGISQADIERLNYSFVRVGAQAEGAISGLGLGLFIARTVAEQHGGGLIAEAEPGLGSTFTLYVPLHGPDYDAA